MEARLTPTHFIVGAPKAGTSTLFRWLDAHPEILGTSPKETWALIDPGSPLAVRRDRVWGVASAPVDDWQQVFPSYAGESVRLEGSTHTLYQQTAAPRVRDLPTEPRVLVLLRDPVHRLLSSFRYTRANLARVRGDLDEQAFVDALAGDPGRLDCWVTDPVSRHVLRHDAEYSCYGRWLPVWYRALGPQRVRLVQFEKLRDDPMAELTAIIRWMGLSERPLERLDLRAHNSTSSRPRFRRLHRWARSAARYVAGTPFRDPLERVYQRLQRVEPGRPPGEARRIVLPAVLGRMFREDRRWIAENTPIDLTAWSDLEEWE